MAFDVNCMCAGFQQAALPEPEPSRNSKNGRSSEKESEKEDAIADQNISEEDKIVNDKLEM